MPEGASRQSYADDETRWRELMVRAQAGDEEDYRQLLTEISAVLSRYLASRIGGQEYVEDCVQEVLVAVHQARHTYDSKQKFRAWLFAIARHKAIDCLRRTNRRVPEEALSGAALNVADPGDDMESAVAGGHLLRGLAEPFRDAITLTKLHGLSVSEAASRLAISESALKVRVHRGLARLRKLMEADAL